MKSRGETAALVQQSVDLSAIGKELDGILGDLHKGEALLEHGGRILRDRRYRAGLLFSAVRKTFPATGPRAAGWGKFCEARGISKDTAWRYIEAAEMLATQPELADRRSWMELYQELGLAVPAPKRLGSPQAAAKAPAPTPLIDAPHTDAEMEAAGFTKIEAGALTVTALHTAATPFERTPFPDEPTAEELRFTIPPGRVPGSAVGSLLGLPTDEDAAADLGIKLTPALVAFGAQFEGMAQRGPMIATPDQILGLLPPEVTGPIRRSAAGAETIVGDASHENDQGTAAAGTATDQDAGRRIEGPTRADRAGALPEVRHDVDPVPTGVPSEGGSEGMASGAGAQVPVPLPLEAQVWVCLLCLPWKDRYEVQQARADSLEDRWGKAEARATAAEAELHTLRNQMQVLHLRAEAARDEPPVGVVEVELRDGTIAELIIERDPDTGAPTGEESQERRRTPKAPAKDKGKPAKRNGR